MTSSFLSVTWLLPCVLLLAHCDGCQQKFSQHVTVPVEVNLPESTNTFSVDMYKKLSQGHRGSLVFSPFSVYTAMAMVLLGADGRTKDQIERALIVSDNIEAIDDEDIHEELWAYSMSLGEAEQKSKENKAENTTLSIGNAIFMQPWFSTTSEFSSQLDDFYEVSGS